MKTMIRTPLSICAWFNILIKSRLILDVMPLRVFGRIECHPDNTGILQLYFKAAKCACIHGVLHSLFAVRLQFSLIRPPGLNAIAVKGCFLRTVKSVPNGKSVGLLVEQWNDVVPPLQNPVHGSYGGD